MKSIAASKADSVFADSTVSIEKEVGDRRVDVLVEFARPQDRLGRGIAIEVQYKHESKDRDAVQAEFRSHGYSVLWLDADHFNERDVDLSAGTLAAWWAAQVPDAQEWTGYHNIVKWLRQPLNPTVELEVPFPDALFSEDNALLWVEGLYNAHTEDDGWSSVFSAPLYDSGRTRSEIGLAVNGMGRPRVFLRKVRGNNVEQEEDPNLFRRTRELRRISKMLATWDDEQRKDWAARQVGMRSDENWVRVWKADTGMCRLKLLCRVETGEPVIGLEDHYQGSVTALVDPEMASESIEQVIRARYRIE
ncbi:hypothetical protein C440_02513 [Haloferax mucosum ATCC BAA-1512]|uniref:Uncharacterized protein n=1 Tax=Haloferax mucosum ATCC BAA-1512 TaxID=662479 RepID=M0IRK1_9EURY|nr:hypothetical protein [Haloferax mucosum]ELZ98084.1 hypothetical protein C440_02513 [Haloferax mucosum ATCC BAA-1512]